MSPSVGLGGIVVSSCARYIDCGRVLLRMVHNASKTQGTMATAVNNVDESGMAK
jgi:hypothetical protein